MSLRIPDILAVRNQLIFTFRSPRWAAIGIDHRIIYHQRVFNVSVLWASVHVLAMAEEQESSFNLIHLSGPLTVEAILKTLQQRFVDGQCFVSS